MQAKEVNNIAQQKRKEKFGAFYKNELLPAILKSANEGGMVLNYTWFEEYMVDMLCQLGYNAYYHDGSVRIHWNSNSKSGSAK